MEKVAAHILKSDDVKLEGQCHLDVPQAKPGLQKGKSVASTTTNVRIVENHPEFAVIEIICPCGTKTYLRCEYADDESSAETSGPDLQNNANEPASQTQNGASGTPAQTTDQTK